ELLRVRASGRVDTLAEGRGDRDGLARLAWDAAATAAQDWTDPALLLLRARAGSRTTVTPLESANVPMTGGWRPSPPMELTFGVTERLL
ncbi:hypothetical protein, partial [Pseudomonas sp. AH2 (2023)]|uniref:hypothetical protein n=1 Tax=Pseudomonas sp. AH2 (2023) TaxID=3048599 RepID=UPI002B2390EB